MVNDRATIERFKRQVAEEWRNPRLAGAYRKWDDVESEWGRPARDLIIQRAMLAPGQDVLDVGSGHGEPALAIAEIVGPVGRVAMTDMSPDLLAIAIERARAAGLGNVTSQTADAHDLPFPNDTFDRVTCRWTAMYFADAQAAFREARRVLKPGGAAVYLVWGGFDQPIFRDVVGTLFHYVPFPEDEPGAPSPFKFAEPGSLMGALKEAGFVDVQEAGATLPTTFRGSPERWWEWFVDMAVPLQPLVAALAENVRERAMEEIHTSLGRFYDGELVKVPVDVIVASGRKAP